MQEEFVLAERLERHLEAGQPARSLECDNDEKEILKSWFLLTTKPVIYAANIAENDISADYDKLPLIQVVQKIAESDKAEVLVISAQIEEEIASMEDADKKEFLTELGLGESGLNRLIHKCYSLLGLISFLTAGADECRAWTIKNGTKAPQAAGKIHSDFERGFIRAEIVNYDALILSIW